MSIYAFGFMLGILFGFAIVAFIIWLGWRNNPLNPRNQECKCENNETIKEHR